MINSDTVDAHPHTLESQSRRRWGKLVLILAACVTLVLAYREWRYASQMAAMEHDREVLTGVVERVQIAQSYADLPSGVNVPITGAFFTPFITAAKHEHIINGDEELAQLQNVPTDAISGLPYRYTRLSDIPKTLHFRIDAPVVFAPGILSGMQMRNLNPCGRICTSIHFDSIAGYYGS